MEVINVSLCFGFKVKDGVMFAIDGRSSYKHMGTTYCTRYDTKKFVVHNGVLYITFGRADAIYNFHKLCNDSSEETNIDMIFDEAINQCSLDSFMSENRSMLLAVFSFDLNNSVINEQYYDKKGKHKNSCEMQDIFSFGLYQDEVIDYSLNNIDFSKVNIFTAFKLICDKFNRNDVGGHWRIFLSTNEGTKLIVEYNCVDSEIEYAPNWIQQKIDENDFENQIVSPRISGGNMYGGAFWNENETTKLVLGMNGNLGDLNLIRNADGTSVFQIYDDISITDLKRDGVHFLATTGKSTYAYGDWDFSKAKTRGIVAVFG